MAVVKGRCHGHRWVRLDDPIFRSRHYVFYGPRRTAAKAMSQVLGVQCDAPPMESAGSCAVADQGGAAETLMHIDSTAAGEHLETLIHEAHHATFYTLNKARLRLTPKTTEVFAYFHEWLVREGRKGVGI